jgi:hypothetical protein
MTRTVDLHHHVIPDFYWEASHEDAERAPKIPIPPDRDAAEDGDALPGPASPAGRRASDTPRLSRRH